MEVRQHQCKENHTQPNRQTTIFLIFFLLPVTLFADDLYLKNGLLYRNVLVVDTTGSILNIMRDSVRIGIQLKLIEKIERLEFNPNRKSTREVYSQSKADDFAQLQLQKALLPFVQEEERKRWIKDSTRIHDNAAEDSTQIHDNTVTIEFRNGKKINAINFTVGPDSCIWKDPITRLSIAAQTKDLKKVIRRDKPIGALVGYGIGLVGGAVAGGLLGSAFEQPGQEFIGPTGGGIILGAVIGGIVGAVVGQLLGYKYEYEFEGINKTSSSGTGDKREPQKNP